MTRDELQAVLDGKTKPVGSLGRLEDLAVRAGAVLGQGRPDARASLTIFAADHGIAAAGVSAFPAEVTAQMVANFLAGGAAATVIAAALGVPVTVADCGVATRVEGAVDMRLGAGTANAAEGPAMTPDQAERAVAQGRAHGAADPAPLAAFGEMGIGNTATAALLAHKLTGLPLADLVGRGTGLDEGGVARKLEVLERAAARTGDLSPMEALAEVGGFEIGTMAGAMLGAAGAGRLVIVDGFIATAAALLARALEPGCAASMIHAHASAERGHAVLLEHLAETPLLDLDMRLGEGTGALLAVPMVRAALALFGMASFESAGVSGRA